MRRLFALARRSRGGGPLPADERLSNPASLFFSARRSRSESHWIPAFAGMTAVIFSLLAGIASAQDLLIRNATVHTATARGSLQGADVLVKDGRIAAVGSGLQAGGATVVDAQGRPLTPALFGGITDIGVEEVSGESSTVDSALALGANAADMPVRP